MFVRFLAALVMVGAGLGGGQASAQEDLTKGKSPAQLYASDCVECHKSPRALGQRDNAGKLAGFLRVHYTASRESAAAIAQYLVAMGPEPRASRPAGTAAKPRPAANQEQGKEQNKEQNKPEQGKSTPAEEPAKAAEKPAEKPAEAAKPAEPAQEKAAPAAATPPASEPAPAAPAASPASPPADPQ